MDDFSLQCFIALGKQLNFTNVAQFMHISQPTLSRIIANLETELGCKLLNRTAQRTSLTSAGKRFLDGAQKILELHTTVLEETRLAQLHETAQIRIGYMPQSAFSVMPILLERASRLLPSTEVLLLTDQHYALHSNLDEGMIDMAIFSAFEGDAEKRWCTEYLYSDQWCVLLREEHPLCSQPFITPEQIAHMTWLFYDSYDSILNRNAYSEGPTISRLKNMFSVTPGSFCTISDLIGVFSLVVCGIGVGILPMHMKRFSPPGIRFVPLQISNGTRDFTIECVLCYKKENGNAAIPAILDIVRGMREEGLLRPDSGA